MTLYRLVRNYIQAGDKTIYRMVRIYLSVYRLVRNYLQASAKVHTGWLETTYRLVKTIYKLVRKYIQAGEKLNYIQS